VSPLGRRILEHIEFFKDGSMHMTHAAYKAAGGCILDEYTSPTRLYAVQEYFRKLEEMSSFRRLL